ncbi:MAG: hypothetical protein JNM19_18835, partial [Chitinophagaceae bacterium]|nr:hypothetical protein [Chitinophagaceae bacterium]
DQFVGGLYKIRAYTSWMQNEKETSFFVKEITLQKVIAPRILMKLDFPEKGYGAGDAVKANFSMRNLTDEPIANYNGKFTVSVGGKELNTQSFKTDLLGKAVIQFELPSPLTTPDGLLNVKVEYDSYTESISRGIPIVLNNIDLQFMPEGGTLVEGITSTVAFKALNENGKAADIKGLIKDNNGATVASFESYHFGMGKFLFTPQAGLSYKAVITSPAGINKEYYLPLATADGVVMQVTQANKKIIFNLTASARMEIKLKGSFRNTTYHLQKIQLRKGINTITLDEAVFPTGIAQFTLFTAGDMPLAERLVFTNEDKNLRVHITMDKQKYAPREKVKLSIQTLDVNNKPVPSNFSLSVVDDKLWTFADDKQDHIFSWLLLSSELKGKIEEPQFYFKKEEPKSVPALDLLMLTHGYRYFDFTEYITKENTLQHLPDQDNILSGQVLSPDNKPVLSKVFLMNVVTGGKAMEIVTDSSGHFFFSDLQPQAHYYVFAQAMNKKEKINILILQNGLGYNPMKARQFKPLVSSGSEPVVAGIRQSPVIPALKKQVLQRDRIEGGEAFLEGKAVVAQEVVVTALGPARQAKELGYSLTKVTAAELANARVTNLQNGLTG